jgi:hypothetical protein
VPRRISGRTIKFANFIVRPCMRSRTIKSTESASSDLRATGCETMAWETEVAEQLNMERNL